MTSSFGARLRQQREERGIPLSVIAGQTKIKASLLEGLERDDLAHWPPGIFRRAYVRAYALAIGLNPDAVVTEFLAIYPERPEIVDPDVIAQESGASSNGGAPTRLRHLFGSAVGSLSRLRRGSQPDDRLQPQGTTGNSNSAVLGISRAHPPQGTTYGVLGSAAREVSEPVLSPAASEEALSDSAPCPSGSQATDSALSPTASEASDLAPCPTGSEATLPEEVPMAVPVAAPTPTVDLLAAAELCTALGRVENAGQMPPLLRDAARILGARGLIIWVWDSIAEELQPALVFGYPDKLVAQLPRLKPDADNLTAAAFRSSETLALAGHAEASAALAVPMLTPGTGAGVLAIELPPGHEEADAVRAIAIVFAAMLAQLVGGAPAAPAQLPSPGDRPSSFSTAV